MAEALARFSEFVTTHLIFTFVLFAAVLIAEGVWYFLLEHGEPQRNVPEARKEQLKLRSVMFNNLAVAMFSIGFVTPLVGALYHLISAPAISDVVTMGVGWLVAGIVFHFFGIAVLRGLR